MSETVVRIRPERILELSERLSTVAGEKIGEIASVNRAAKMLAINALIVAAKAGEAGRGFSIVAEEFKKISLEIDSVAGALDKQVRADLDELTVVGAAILEQLRGQRLIDLALNAIELIDRNLYERTCDVRWWATDSAIVAALAADATTEAMRYAGERLKVILNAYTVYLDLWVCDPSGRVVASGRPERYPSVRDMSVAEEPWFKAALRTHSGDDFIASDIKTERALDGAAVATYAASVRDGGRVDGRVLGVLGVHFDWRPQAQAVVKGVRLGEEERRHTRVLILDQNRRVLAASDDRGVLNDRIALDVSKDATGSYVKDGATIAYALTPGYETYKGLGWYGCLVQAAGA